jgi:hypothetical protein
MIFFGQPEHSIRYIPRLALIPGREDNRFSSARSQLRGFTFPDIPVLFRLAEW